MKYIITYSSYDFEEEDNVITVYRPAKTEKQAILFAKHAWDLGKRDVEIYCLHSRFQTHHTIEKV